MYETLKVEPIPVTSDWSFTPTDDRHDHPALRPFNASVMRMFNIGPGSNIKIPDFTLGAGFSPKEAEYWSLRLASTIYWLKGVAQGLTASSMPKEEKQEKLAAIQARLQPLMEKAEQLHTTLGMLKREDDVFTPR